MVLDADFSALPAAKAAGYSETKTAAEAAVFWSEREACVQGNGV